MRKIMLALALLALAGCASQTSTTETQVVLSFQQACKLADGVKDTTTAWVVAKTAAKQPISDATLNTITNVSHSIAGVCQGPLPSNIATAIALLTADGVSLQTAVTGGQ